MFIKLTLGADEHRQDWTHAVMYDALGNAVASVSRRPRWSGFQQAEFRATMIASGFEAEAATLTGLKMQVRSLLRDPARARLAGLPGEAPLT